MLDFFLVLIGLIFKIFLITEMKFIEEIDIKCKVLWLPLYKVGPSGPIGGTDIYCDRRVEFLKQNRAVCKMRETQSINRLKQILLSSPKQILTA